MSRSTPRLIPSLGLAVLLVTGCGGIGSASAPPAESQPTVTASESPTSSPSASPSQPEASATTHPDGTVTIEAAAYPMILGAGDDAIWGTVFDPTKRAIIRIDSETHEVTTVVDDLPAHQLHGIGVNGSVWVSSWDTSQVTQYDGTTGEHVQTIAVGSKPIEPVFAFGDVWTLNHHGGSVTRIDTDTGTVEATIEFANTGEAGPLTWGVAGGLLWVAAPNTPKVVGIDPDTNKVRHTIEVAPDCSPGVGAVADKVWLADCGQNPVLDPETLEPVGHSGELPPAYGLMGDPLVVSNRLWSAQYNRDTDVISSLYAVDLETFEVIDEFDLQDVEAPEGAYGFDSIWLQSGGTVVRIPAAALAD